MEKMSKRDFLVASIGAGIGLSAARKALAQEGSAAPARTDRAASADSHKAPSRTAKTTKLFKSPDGFPNAIAVTPEGLWIAEQKETGQAAVNYHLAEPKDLTEHAWLVDWKGKVLKT